jgi:multiple sugar transport system ATP-binding protein
MAKLVLQDLVKSFGGPNAVDRVSLTVSDQEFVVLVGPSGCGKTTVLRMVAGLEVPSSGHVFMDDVLIDKVPPGSRDVAMVFQNYALFSHMTVYDNLSFGLKIRKTPRGEIAPKVSRIAEMLQLEQLLDRMPRQLSGGERQRVALGRALIRNPKLYLLDEPLSNLDALLRVQMRTEILKLCKTLRVTVIHVTHDQTEALSMGDRIAVMRAGRIEQVGPPDEVYNRPANRYVASFIGSPMMNFVDGGRLTNVNGEYWFEATGLRVALPLELSAAVARIRPSVDTATDFLLGIRPEAIRLGNVQEDGRYSDAFPTRVDLVQSLGSQTVVSVSLGTSSFLVLADPSQPLARGEETQLRLDRSKMHMFQKSTGKSVLHF